MSQRKSDWHIHRCEKCEVFFSHHKSRVVDNERAHSCPECGEFVPKRFMPGHESSNRELMISFPEWYGRSQEWIFDG